MIHHHYGGYCWCCVVAPFCDDVSFGPANDRHLYLAFDVPHHSFGVFSSFSSFFFRWLLHY